MLSIVVHLNNSLFPGVLCLETSCPGVMWHNNTDTSLIISILHSQLTCSRLPAKISYFLNRDRLVLCLSVEGILSFSSIWFCRVWCCYCLVPTDVVHCTIGCELVCFVAFFQVPNSNNCCLLLAVYIFREADELMIKIDKVLVGWTLDVSLALLRGDSFLSYNLDGFCNAHQRNYNDLLFSVLWYSKLFQQTMTV
jgi:hypothetical protein